MLRGGSKDIATVAWGVMESICEWRGCVSMQPRRRGENRIHTHCSMHILIVVEWTTMGVSGRIQITIGGYESSNGNGRSIDRWRGMPIQPDREGWNGMMTWRHMYVDAHTNVHTSTIPIYDNDRSWNGSDPSRLSLKPQISEGEKGAGMHKVGM